MPPRRSHKKSRAGCQRCKLRKIKCDEVHPRCRNCAKHGVSCDFETTNALDDSASAASPSPSTPAVNLDVPMPSPSALSPTQMRATPSVSQPIPSPGPDGSGPASVPVSVSVSVSVSGLGSSLGPGLSSDLGTDPARHAEVDRLLELRLLHQYTTSTCKTLLTNSPATDDIWQRAVPHLAFQGKTYLADAMLSVAALHLRSQNPSDKAVAQASHAYSASTLAAYVSTLNSGITSDNAEALFLTASLIAFQATASRIFTKEDAETSGKDNAARYTLPMAWFHAFQGVKTVVTSSWQWIRNSNVVQAVIDSQPSFQLDLNPLNPDSFFGHLLDELDDELAREAQDRITATHQGYFHAVSVLNWAHKNPYAPAALAFPASVSRRFVELLGERRPRALAILACFFALLKRMDNVWWLEDVSRREVMGLVSIFESGSCWWRHLEWPIRIALWDGGTIPLDVWGVDYKRESEADKSSSKSMTSHIELFSKFANDSTTAPPVPGQAELELISAPVD